MKEKRKFDRFPIRNNKSHARIRLVDSEEWLDVQLIDRSVQGFGLIFPKSGYRIGDEVLLEIDGQERACEIRNLTVLGNSAFRMGISFAGCDDEFFESHSEFELATLV